MSQLPSYYQKMNDASLWEAFKCGDEAAFKHIYDTQVYALYSYGHRITSDNGLVEDCLQDLFADLWEKKDRLSATSSIKFYLFKALRRRLLRKLIQGNRTKTDNFLEDFQITLSQEALLIAQQISRDQLERLSQAVEKLSKRQKEIIYLKYYENLSFEEIAATMSISVEATYNILSKAMKSLRYSMKNRKVLATLYTLLLF